MQGGGGAAGWGHGGATADMLASAGTPRSLAQARAHPHTHTILETPSRCARSPLPRSRQLTNLPASRIDALPLWACGAPRRLTLPLSQDTEAKLRGVLDEARPAVEAYRSARDRGGSAEDFLSLSRRVSDTTRSRPHYEHVRVDSHSCAAVSQAAYTLYRGLQPCCLRAVPPLLPRGAAPVAPCG